MVMETIITLLYLQSKKYNFTEIFFVLKWFDFFKHVKNLKSIKNDLQNIVFANFIAEENRLQWVRLNGIKDNGNNREYKKIYPDWQVPNHSLIPNFTLQLILILLSVGYWNQFAYVP
jgi:hypothetical protein